MNIYIDAFGLTKYLTALFRKIRLENRTCRSPFNIEPPIWHMDQTFVKQTFFADFKCESQKSSLPKNDRVFDNALHLGMDKKMMILEAINDFLPKEKSEKEDFLYNLDEWVKHKIAFKPYNYSENTKTQNTFKDSNAISIMKERNDLVYRNIDLNYVLEELQKIFFIEKESSSLNTIRFTQEMKGWGILAHAMENEEDIVIVDRYFFKAHGSKFSKEEAIDFIKKICGAKRDKKKNIVILYENDKNNICSTQFDDLVDKLNDLCYITFVGVYSKVGEEEFANRVLHDRYVISNTRVICSGHSFTQYFKDNKIFSANGSMFITIGSIADKFNASFVEKSIHYLQKEIFDRNEINRCCFIYPSTKDMSKILSLSLKPKNTGKIK